LIYCLNLDPGKIGLTARQVFYQLIRDIGTFNTHDAFLSAAVTQKVDAAVSDNSLIRVIL